MEHSTDPPVDPDPDRAELIELASEIPDADVTLALDLLRRFIRPPEGAEFTVRSF